MQEQRDSGGLAALQLMQRHPMPKAPLQQPQQPLQQAPRTWCRFLLEWSDQQQKMTIERLPDVPLRGSAALQPKYQHAVKIEVTSSSSDVEEIAPPVQPVPPAGDELRRPASRRVRLRCC